MTRIRKSWQFDAAHQLPSHDGKCARLHGHTYKVVIEVSGPVQPDDGRSESGMILDFYELGRVWKEKLEPIMDHRFLNETIPEEYLPTTAENLSQYILDVFHTALLPYPVTITAAEVWETPSSCAITKPLP